MKSQIKDILQSRILVLDGAMGTMILHLNLTEEQYRGQRFRQTEKLQKGNNDLLTLTQPEIIEQIHRKYLEAGADIIQTNTFNATSVSMKEYGMQKHVREMNVEAARIARNIADEFSNINSKKPRFVAGSIGPTHKTTSMSESGKTGSNIGYDELQISYKEQIEALMDGGVDILLFETVFDTQNAKAGLLAAHNIFQKKGEQIPIMVSATFIDKKGSTFSGETIIEFFNSINHSNLLSIGLNCSFGASTMKQHLIELKKTTDLFISVHPNAGLPNKMGKYDETPKIMASYIKEFIDLRLVNIVGGCCGTTPQHIAKLVEIADGATPSIPEDRYSN